jgi:hypothetical protein
MSGLLNEQQIYEEARQRIRDKRNFYTNLIAWAIVNIVIIIIWLIYSLGRSPWFLWPLCIWGVVILYKFLRVFVINRKLDRNAIDREIEKIKRELK